MKIRQLFEPWKVMALLAATILSIGCSDKTEKNQGAQALPVKVATPLKQTLQTKNTFTGRFQPVEQSEVKARVSGYIVKANFSEGDLVNKGTPLFYIDRRPFQVALDAANADLARQQATVEERETNFRMVNGLRETGAISNEEFDRRRLSVQTAKADLQRAEAAVTNARLNLDFTTVRAPIRGRVGRRMVTEGNLVSGGSEMATLLTSIVQTKPIHFYISASENDLNILFNSGTDRTDIMGDSIAITLNGNEKQVKGNIDFIGNQLQRGTGSLELRAIVQNKDERIQPGMFGEAVLYGSEIENALLVPETVIGSNQNIKYVYSIDENNQVQMKPIQIGGLYANNMRLVISGLSKEDKVIINNIQKVRPGMLISPIEATMDSQKTEAQ